MSTVKKSFWARNKEALNSRSAKVGGYSFVLTIVVLAILVAVNVLAGALPTTMTQFDISSTRLYSLTSSTKVVVNNLDKDVTIYWICQVGEEDSVMERLLNVYDAMSDHVEVVRKNPDVNPTFAAQYTDETVTNNSLVVKSGDKYRYIPYSDIYEYDTSDYYTTGSVSASYDGEGEITTAIAYVVSDDLPQIYLLTGHGEKTLPDSFKSSLTKANLETVEDFTLLNVDEIPEECDLIMIYAPTSDISDKEAEMLTEYVENGGHLMVFSGPQDQVVLENLNSVLGAAGVTVENGITVELDRNYYAFGYPYILLPNIESSDITDVMADNNSFVIAALTQAYSVGASDSFTVDKLLTTSDTSFLKADGYAMTTFEQEEQDPVGPFALAVAARHDDSEGRMVWFATDNLMDETYSSYSSGANTDIVMNSISWMVGEGQTISIRAKSLNNSYLTISEMDATRIKLVLIGILPVAYLLYGVEEVVRRKKGIEKRSA